MKIAIDKSRLIRILKVNIVEASFELIQSTWIIAVVSPASLNIIAKDEITETIANKPKSSGIKTLARRIVRIILIIKSEI